mmetsp:Transcript_40421/g.64824  ORF Transcript_40421/g.64824 Transcript_40421/m.64824 type:complete len:254 (+) Transcript_40421:180-941(+)
MVHERCLRLRAEESGRGAVGAHQRRLERVPRSVFPLAAQHARHPGSASRTGAPKAEVVLVVVALRVVRGERTRARRADLRILSTTAPRVMDLGPALVVCQLTLPAQHEPCPRHLLVDCFVRGVRRSCLECGIPRVVCRRVRGRRRGWRLLVAPVRGEPVFCCAVHLHRANLHLKHVAGRLVSNHCVQGLISVVLGMTHIVLRFACHLDPPRAGVHRCQREVAVRLGGDDDTERAHIVDLRHARHALRLHLAVH